jgi:hypothetical protein
VSLTVHAIIPLSLLEAIRNLDTPMDDGLSDVAAEMVSKRLGLSTTVLSQIERYRAQVTRGKGAPTDEAVLVFRLVSRRSDASLVFADAGRRAARHAVRELARGRGLLLRATPSFWRRRLGLQVARDLARGVFRADLRRADTLAAVTLLHSLTMGAGAEGEGCYFYGAAFAELLRLLTGFEGAMLHDRCRSRGDDECCWTATAVEAYE